MGWLLSDIYLSQMTHLPSHFLTKSTDGYSGLLSAENKIGMMFGHGLFSISDFVRFPQRGSSLKNRKMRASKFFVEFETGVMSKYFCTYLI